jgi:hypothetical protein
MAVVEALSGDEVSYDPASPIPVVVKVHQVVTGDDVWAAQDNPIISAASMIVVVPSHRHTQ